VGAEFESEINRITVDLGSILLSSTTTTISTILQPRTSSPPCVPLPSFEGCGLVFKLDLGKNSGKQELRGDP